MLNLAEILTILIGCLLALVFIDGIRRAIRIRKSKLKVDLISSEKIDLDFEEEWKGYEVQSEVITDEEELGESYISPSSALNIIHLHDQSSQVFSESTLSQALVFYNFIYEENGIFSILDSKFIFQNPDDKKLKANHALCKLTATTTIKTTAQIMHW